MNPNLSLFPGRTSVDQETWDARNRSIAHRLLSGSGQAMLVAYREEPTLTLTSIAHGIAADGTLVVATTEPELAFSRSDADVMDVRLSIEKESPDPTVEIVAAAVHMLGQARWLPLDETAEAIASGVLPERVASIASSPGGYLAEIYTERVLVHDAAGIVPVYYDDIREQHHEACCETAAGGDLFADSFGELAGLDVLSRFGYDVINDLFGAVMLSMRPGALLARQPIRLGCDHVRVAVLCVDIDRTGLTLMRIDKEEAITAFIPFSRRIVSGVELRREIGRLMELDS